MPQTQASMQASYFEANIDGSVPTMTCGKNTHLDEMAQHGR